MQQHIDIRTLLISSSDRLVYLHRLFCVTQDSVEYLRRTLTLSSPFRCYARSFQARVSTYRLRQVMHPVRDLFGRTLAGWSAPAPSAGADAEPSIGIRLCCCFPIVGGFCRLFIAIAILGKSTHPPLPELCLQAPHVEKWQNSGSGFHFPIRTSQMNSERDTV